MRSSVLLALSWALCALAVGCTEPNPPGMGEDMPSSNPMPNTVAKRLSEFKISPDSYNYVPDGWKEMGNELSIQALNNCPSTGAKVDLLCIFTSSQISRTLCASHHLRSCCIYSLGAKAALPPW